MSSTNKDCKNNLPTLFLCSNDKKDRAWTDCFVKYLRFRGLKSIHASTDILGVNSIARQIEDLLLKVRKLVIVLSRRCLVNNVYLNMIDCIVLKIFQDQLGCDIIPALLDTELSVPLLLSNLIPANVYLGEVEKLEKALYNCSEYQLKKQFMSSLIGLNNDSIRLHQLNKITFPKELPEKIKEIGRLVMRSWGLSVKNEYFDLNINTLQNVSSYQRVCLKDLFETFLATSSVRGFRLYGVKCFNFQSLFTNSQVYTELIDVYKKIMTIYISFGQHICWYQYRRNGLRPDDEAEKGFKPLLDAKSSFNSGQALLPKYESYDSRLASFTNFQIESFTVQQLIAEAGFFSVNHLDVVQCYFCGQSIRILNIDQLWHPFDSSKCPLNKRKIEISKKINCALLNNELPELRMNKLSVRIETFMPLVNANKFAYDQLKQFAEAGFYYLGSKEDIVCYSCNLGLTRIKDTSNPLKVHFTFSPNCLHLSEISDEHRRALTNTIETGDEIEDVVPYIEAELFLHDD